jgi:2-phospho-L-lactate guanylyltransferase
VPPPNRSAGWVVVVPLKGGARAKSRLAADPALSRAIAQDCLDAVLGCPAVDRVVVVTSDRLTGAWAADAGARVVGERTPGAGLNAAISDGARGVPSRCAALLGDLPALRPRDLADALDAAGTGIRAAAAAFVPDADGTGTVLLAARSGRDLDPAFGNGSAAAHAARGALRLELDLPRLRRDVDDAADLLEARRLGVGPHTARALAGTRVTACRRPFTASTPGPAPGPC